MCNGRLGLTVFPRGAKNADRITSITATYLIFPHLTHLPRLWSSSEMNASGRKIEHVSTSKDFTNRGLRGEKKKSRANQPDLDYQDQKKITNL